MTVVLLSSWLVLGGVRGTSDPKARSYDAFQWWADIWIPSLVGLSTVGVAVVALVVSHNASVLARKVEEQRRKAADDRDRSERKRWLQELALQDARVLNRWVVETYEPGRYVFGQPPSASRTPEEQAGVDARVALEQSIVPGADELLRITAYDLKNASEYIIIDHDESVMAKARKRRVGYKRRERTRERIRAWAIDPDLQAPRLLSEWEQIERDRLGYLMFGEDLTPPDERPPEP